MRWSLVSVGWILSICCANRLLTAQTLPSATRLAETRQVPAVLQLRDEAEVGTAIVRVRDVVQTVGPPPAGWESIAEAPLGLIPRDGRRLRMERQRIAESILRSGILRDGVRWTGPETVSIRYVESRLPAKPTPRQNATTPTFHPAASAVPQHSAPATSAVPSPAGVRVASNTTDTSPRATPVARAVAFSDSAAAKPIAPLLPAERNRIERLILMAFQQTHADLLEQFEVSLVTTDPNLNQLEDLRAINTLRLVEPPGEGRIPLAVNGDKELSTVEAVVTIELVPLPVVVATTQALNRGDVLTSRDLQTITIARNRFSDRQITDFKDAIGKELTRPISRDRPLTFDDVSEPIVIDRNETVELRVTGAGVQITTAAKALGPAAMGETVLVETLSQKRRLTARAIAPGVVEIVTRPPQIRNN